MGFLPFGKGKDSIEDDSSSLTSSSTANVESSIPRTTVEADGVEEKKVANATSMASGIEGKDVIDDSISKGRVMLEQLKAKYNNASAAPSSLKSLNVPSMKAREADVLILEEKVSRMTNELNVAIREKGVAKMQLEEFTAESLLLKINLNESEAKKEEMTLRHERAAKAILTLQKREEEAEERIAEMKKREERFKEDIVEMAKNVDALISDNEAKDELLKEYDRTKVLCHERTAQAELADERAKIAEELLEERTIEFEKTVEEQALEFERKLEKMADEKTEERTKELSEELYDVKKTCEEKEKKCDKLTKECEEKLTIVNEQMEETAFLREEKKKYDDLLIEKAKMEANHSEFLDKLAKEHAAAIVARDVKLEEFEVLCNDLTESNKELTTRCGAASGKYKALQDKLTAVRRGAVDAFVGIDQNVMYLSDEDVRLKYNLALEEARTAEEYAKLCDRRSRDFEDSLLALNHTHRELLEETRALRAGEKQASFGGYGYTGPEEVLVKIDEVNVELGDAKTALENAVSDLKELQRVNDLLEERLHTRDEMDKKREYTLVESAKEVERQQKEIRQREIELELKSQRQREFIKDIMDRQKNGLLSIGSKFGVDVDVDEEKDDVSSDDEEEEEEEEYAENNKNKKNTNADSSFSISDVQRRGRSRDPVEVPNDSAEKLTPNSNKSPLKGGPVGAFSFKESPLMPQGIDELQQYISSDDRKNLFMSFGEDQPQLQQKK
ncbi:unnamed protein product [Bathycoccus prasinos]|jgi:hypothetical protein